MEFNNQKELEEMIESLSKCEKKRLAGKVDNRGNISLSDKTNDNEPVNISLNHVMEYYIYATYFKPEDKVVAAEKPFGRYFRDYGDLCMNKQHFKAAEAAYKDAIAWNPVDLDSILALAECYKHMNMLERYILVTKQAYKYCCTRATMARYYRNMGFYYLGKYEPEVARCCYVYSNIYFHTENADSELKYIEEALKEKTPEYTIEKMQEILTQKEIEPGPDPDTIGIVYRVGEIMMEDDEFVLARDCFSIVYDITREQGLEKLLEELERY